MKKLIVENYSHSEITKSEKEIMKLINIIKK